MSGTSLDGIDAVLTDFRTANTPISLQTHFVPYDDALRAQLLSLHTPDHDELNRAAMLSNYLSHLYAKATADLLINAGFSAQQIAAIGCHGQTIRHCPETEKRYSIQLINTALLTELTGITVVSDFRSRDIAAGGQGAPLVPAFHEAVFKTPRQHRIIVNIGGIANITNLDPQKAIIGFDSGPGNLLMDAWCQHHLGKPYDQDGHWAGTGQIIPELLEALLADTFFSYKPPKSTGRDWFNVHWLRKHLTGTELAQDVQATLLELTSLSIARAIEAYCWGATEVYICGGGARNTLLLQRLERALPNKRVALTDQLAVAADWVEALAFAWLARQTCRRKPGSLASVTGATGNRILGAIYYA
ncbi:MAG: anhydro-N-acetylmuramic acid kinase [Nitrosomonas sp.]|nr:MAG: anhydro-N-acetylmuramic acid kinase [Nitrosomonas sp.]